MEEIVSGQATSAAMDRGSPAEPVTLQLLGLVLVPDVVTNTPAWVEQVLPSSVASRAGILPDDLIIEIQGVPVANREELLTRLGHLDRDQVFRMTIRRNEDYLELELICDR